MSLPSGTKFGPYEIVSPVGAGGVGEVYRAKGPLELVSNWLAELKK